MVIVPDLRKTTVMVLLSTVLVVSRASRVWKYYPFRGFTGIQFAFLICHSEQTTSV